MRGKSEYLERFGSRKPKIYFPWGRSAPGKTWAGMNGRERYVCLVALLSVVVSGCFLEAANRSQQQLAGETSRDRARCQVHGDDAACAAYIGDSYIANHCAIAQQNGENPVVGIMVLSGAGSYIVPECAGRVRQIVTMYVACKSGDKASCADIDTQLAAQKEQKERADQIVAQSAVNAQWAQARAQAATAQQIQNQNRLMALQTLIAAQRASTLTATSPPTLTRNQYCGALNERGLGQSYYANQYCH